MSKSAILLLHLGYWMIYLSIWAVVMAAINQGLTPTEEDSKFYLGLIVGVAIVPAVYTFYVYYYFLFPRFLRKGLFTRALIFGLAVSLSSFIIAALTLKITANMGLSCYGQSNYISVLIVTFISFLNGGFAFIIHGFISWFDEIKLKEKLLKKNHEMELALVKSQLDPHFLFNTLNNIDILMLKDADIASAYLNKLSDIMRFMLFETKSNAIPLSSELEYIQKYVELQKLRSANPSYVSYKVKGDSSAKSIVPFVFVPFIENAFKHTNNKKLENAIVIEFEIAESAVQMRCENKVDPTVTSLAECNGMGNDLITKRLNLLYPNRHDLKIESHFDKHSVLLNVMYEKI